MVDEVYVKLEPDPWMRVALMLTLILALVSFCGCAVVSVGGAGLSLGSSAVRATAKAGGAAVDLTGSTVRVGTGGGGDKDNDAPGDG